MKSLTPTMIPEAKLMPAGQTAKVIQNIVLAFIIVLNGRTVTAF